MQYAIEVEFAEEGPAVRKSRMLASFSPRRCFPRGENRKRLSSQCWEKNITMGKTEWENRSPDRKMDWA